MAQRVMLGCQSAGYAFFRVSKAGKSVWSSNLDDFLMHESLFNSIPVLNAIVTSVQIINNGTPLLPSYAAVNNIYHGLGFYPFIVVSGNTSDVSIVFDSSYIYVTYNLAFQGTSGWIGLPNAIQFYVYGMACQ